MFFLLSFSTIIKAQTAEPVFNKKSSWSVITTNLHDDTFFEISTYKIDGDTLIGDKIYSKIFKNNNYFAALRETEDNKVYTYFSLPFLYPEGELLIYDFDWYPYKTLYHELVRPCIFEDSNGCVQAILGDIIDSIQLLDGNYYQYVDYFGRFIKGIGHINGFFEKTFEYPTDGSQRELLCFYIESVLTYLNPKYSDCNLINSINIVSDNESKIKLYPNPSNNFITVELPENLNIDTFKIFDTKGSLIKVYQVCGKNKLEIENLTEGVYLYSAINKNNQNLSGKIIIK